VNEVGGREPTPRLPTDPAWVRALLWSALLGAVAAWALALAQVDRDALVAIGDLGLAPLLPPAYVVSLGLLALGFAVAVARPRPPRALMLGYVAALIAVWHATPAILYGTPRYPFTYKHIGLGEFVQTRGGLDLNYDAYFNWPGFFTLSALTSDLAGLASPMALATWGPVFMNVLIAGALALLARSLAADPRLTWLTVWFFLAANWVGQDYFAPQALGYALHLTVLGLYVGTFAQRRWRLAPAAAWDEGPTGATGGAPLGDGTTGATGSQPAGDGGVRWALQDAGAPVSAARRAGTLALLLVAFAAVVASHQLSPFVTLASVTALVLLRIGRAPLLPMVMLAFLGVWFTYMTPPYLAGHLGELVSGVGRLFDNLNAASRILASPSASVLSDERTFVLNVRQWTTLFVAGLAIFGGVRRVRRGHVDWVAIVLLLMPASLVALQSYGGEIILRVYLFSLPLLAWFAAAVVFPDPASGRRWTAPVAVALLSAVLMTGMTIGYYGNEDMNHVTVGELEVLDALYASAPTGSLVVTATTNPPTRMTRYTDLAYQDLASLAPFDDGARATAASVAALARRLDQELASGAVPAAYVLVTRSEVATARLFGVLPDVDLTELAERLAASPRFEVVRAHRDATVFRLAPPTRGSP
jgi:hypothetical protein